MRRIVADVSRGADGALAITYVIEGAIGRVCLPQPSAPRIAERLWQHTCCEAFVKLHDSGRYHEFNFSPSREWAAYAFERYREGALLGDAALDPHVSVRTTVEALTLQGVIRLPLLSSAYADAELALALSVVVEERGGDLSYWALRHPAGKPDFHHPEAFALELG